MGLGFQKEALLGCNKYSFCKTTLQGKFLDKKMTGERNKNLISREKVSWNILDHKVLDEMFFDPKCFQANWFADWLIWFRL